VASNRTPHRANAKKNDDDDDDDDDRGGGGGSVQNRALKS